MNSIKRFFLGMIISVGALCITSCDYVERSEGAVEESSRKTILEEKADEISEGNASEDSAKDSIETTNQKEEEVEPEVKSELELLDELITVKDYNFEEGVVVDVPNPADIYALVNKKNALPSDYVPNDLVVPDIAYSFSGESDKKKLRQVAADGLYELFEAAKALDINLFAVSGYRSYDTQANLFSYYSNTHGEEAANKFSARPGQSEHQTGLAMDVSAASVNYGLEEMFGETVEGIWIKENAHTYGFIIRYPENKTDITGYQYEPWHLRYIGKEIATYIYENDLTLEEFYEKLNEL